MLRFARLAAWAIASGSVLACGSSHAVDYFAPRASTTSGAGSSSLGAAGAASLAAAAGASAGGSGSGGSVSAGGGSMGSAGSVGADHGSAAGAPSTGACAPALVVGSGMSFTTQGPVCLRVTLDIAGWGCSNFEGRTLKVNGMVVQCAELPLPSKVDGAYYFDVSAGEHEYASLYWY
jgi:hypothetical protein